MREVYLPAYSVGDDAIASSGSAFRRLGQNGIIIGGHHALDAAGWPNGLKPVARIW